MSGQLAARPRARGRLRRSPLGKWEIIGEIAQIAAPYVLDGLSSFMEAAACDIVGAQEAFFRSIGAEALAHRAAVSRAVAGCYTGELPSLVPNPEAPPFVGGQCPGTRYQVNFIAGSAQAGYPTSNVFGFGPFGGFELRPDPARPGWRQLKAILAPFVGAAFDILIQNFSPFETGVSWQILDVVVLNGPNNCGNINDGAPPLYPPGQELPPAPAPGQEVYPPGITTIDFDFNGVLAPVGFFHGSANIDINGNVNLNFGGIDVNISPDLGIDIGDDGSPGGGFGEEPVDFPDFPEIPDYSGDFEGLGDALDSIGNKQDVLGDSLDSVGQGVGVAIDRIQEIKDLLDIDFDDTLRWVSCRGIEDTDGYEGKGLRGLESALKALIALVNLGSNEYCGLLPSAPVGELDSTEFIPSAEIDNWVDVDVASEIRFVSIEVQLTKPGYSVRRGSQGYNEDLQGRFAVVSFLEEFQPGEWIAVGGSVSQYYSLGGYIVPKTENAVRIRVSLGAGSSAVVRRFV